MRICSANVNKHAEEVAKNDKELDAKLYLDIFQHIYLSLNFNFYLVIFLFPKVFVVHIHLI